MLAKLILVVPLLTVIFYTLTGIMKRKVWIAGGTGLFVQSAKNTGPRAIFFGFSFSIIYVFLLGGFLIETQLSLDYFEWITAIILALFFTWFVIFSENNLPKINPFKVIIPALCTIIVISWAITIYFELKY